MPLATRLCLTDLVTHVLMTEPDTKALRILKNTYWSSQGWKKSAVITPADFEYAKNAGIMFENVLLDHDQTIAWAIRSRSKLTPTVIADGFLASLRSRRLEWRSALGSYAFVRHLPKHAFQARPDEHICNVCGISRKETIKDLSVLSFERYMWGGVRHGSPGFAAFDLECFAGANIRQPMPQDKALLKQIFITADAMPADSRISSLEKAIGDIIVSNKSERCVLIEILGYAGILVPVGLPNYYAQFVDYNQRERTPWGKDDWAYPVQLWRGSDGVCWEAVDFWFPGLRT